MQAERRVMCDKRWNWRDGQGQNASAPQATVWFLILNKSNQKPLMCVHVCVYVCVCVRCVCVCVDSVI